MKFNSKFHCLTNNKKIHQENSLLTPVLTKSKVKGYPNTYIRLAHANRRRPQVLSKSLKNKQTLKFTLRKKERQHFILLGISPNSDFYPLSKLSKSDADHSPASMSTIHLRCTMRKTQPNGCKIDTWTR